MELVLFFLAIFGRLTVGDTGDTGEIGGAVCDRLWGGGRSATAYGGG